MPNQRKKLLMKHIFPNKFVEHSFDAHNVYKNIENQNNRKDKNIPTSSEKNSIKEKDNFQILTY